MNKFISNDLENEVKFVFFILLVFLFLVVFVVVFGRVLALPSELLPDPFVSVVASWKQKIKLLFP